MSTTVVTGTEARVTIESFLNLILALVPGVTLAEALDLHRQVEGMITTHKVERLLTEIAHDTPEVVAEMRAGRKIPAIKALRQAQAGVSLLEAKNAVDAIYDGYQPNPWESDPWQSSLSYAGSDYRDDEPPF